MTQSVKSEVRDREPPPLRNNPWPFMIGGLLVVLLFFGGAGTWAALAPLTDAVIAPGVVTVLSKRKTVQHLEGGIVAHILVSDGDQVEPGQILLRLDATRAQASFGIVQGQRDALRAREARLIAERDGQSEILFPDDLLARADDPEVGEILEGQRAQLSARRASYEGEVALLRQQIDQYREQIRGLTAQRDAKDRQLGLISEELTGLEELLRKGFARKTRVLELRREAQEIDGQWGQYVAEIARARSGIADAELRIHQLEKSIREQVVDELFQVQAQLLELSERDMAARDELKRIDIVAPQAGEVVGLGVHTVGGVIAPGQPILDVVPADEELIIECQLRPQDVDKVSAGLEASVRLSAFDLRTTPEVTGVVLGFSADRLVDEATSQSYYAVKVRIPPDALADLGDIRLLPGMPAEVFIKTGERTALSYLVKPFSDGLARAFKD